MGAVFSSTEFCNSECKERKQVTVFNPRQTGGPYWLFRGWRGPSLLLWCRLRSIFRTLCRLAHNLACGTNVSLLAGCIDFAGACRICLVLFREPRAMYAPAGSGLIDVIDLSIQR